MRLQTYHSSMTKHECRSTKNDEAKCARNYPTFVISSFGCNSAFVIQISSLLCRVERSRDISDFVRSSTCSLNKSTGSAAYFLGHARFGRHKFRGEPRKQSNQIVRDQNLSVTVLARADPDRRDADSISDLLSDI